MFGLRFAVFQLLPPFLRIRMLPPSLPLYQSLDNTYLSIFRRLVHNIGNVLCDATDTESQNKMEKFQNGLEKER